MQDDITVSIISLFVSGYIFYLWWGDYTYFKKNGTKQKGALAGATTVNKSLIFLGFALGLILISLNTFTETYLGVASEQSDFVWWAVFTWIGAAFVEELIFRGYLIIEHKGVFKLILSVVLFSLIFAAAHPFIWDFSMGGEDNEPMGFIWNFNLQAILNTIFIFECSLVFYFLRFMPANVNRSLLPCVAAHLAYNLGVFAVKCSQGFISF